MFGSGSHGSTVERKTDLVGPHRADDTADLCVVLGLQVDGLALVIPADNMRIILVRKKKGNCAIKGGQQIRHQQKKIKTPVQENKQTSIIKVQLGEEEFSSGHTVE